MSAAQSVAYIDSSALVKLAIPEPETAPLRTLLGDWDRHVSSALVRVEVVRACARVDARAREVAEHVVGAIDLIAVDDDILAHAAQLEPVELRSLDAIHIASAAVLGDALSVAITYDERMLAAFSSAGISTASPR